MKAVVRVGSSSTLVTATMIAILRTIAEPNCTFVLRIVISHAVRPATAYPAPRIRSIMD
jgi:hypothetical protein